MEDCYIVVPPVQYNQSNVWGGGGGGGGGEREGAVRTGVVLYGKYTEIIIASVQRNLECIVPLCNPWHQSCVEIKGCVLRSINHLLGALVGLFNLLT